jgi:hypothetical protein
MAFYDVWYKIRGHLRKKKLEAIDEADARNQIHDEWERYKKFSGAYVSLEITRIEEVG